MKVFRCTALAACGTALLLFSLSSSCNAAAASNAAEDAAASKLGFSAERLAKLDVYMREKVATGHMPAATLMIARHGQQVMFKSYGTARPDTIFRIYSMTKPVTGLALMLLFEEAKWRFDDPVTKFLPELAQVQVYKGMKPDGTMEVEPLKRSPTMRELVTNSAGFAYGLSTDHPVEAAYQNTNFLRASSANDAVARLAAVPMYSQPGMTWHYSAASDLQGYIIERLSGMSLADFMQRRIFGPLKMKDTAFYVPADKAARFTPVLTLDMATNTMIPATGVLVFDYTKPPGAASGGAGLVSTTQDYARFMQMILNGGELDGARIVSPAALKLYMSNQLSERILAQPQERFQTSNGLGFAVDNVVVIDPAKAATLQGQGTIYWGGAAGTWFWADPTNDLYCVGMMQVLERGRDPTLANIDPETSALLYGALVDPQK